MHNKKAIIGSISTNSIEERVVLLLIRDLRRLGWEGRSSKNKLEVSPPSNYDKKIIKKSMAYKRREIIANNISWIKVNIENARDNLGYGSDVLKSSIEPVIEVCEDSKQRDLFKILRYYWSSPYSDYVGRRIKLIIRDHAYSAKPVIGIAALGSPMMHMSERDKYIGWDLNVRKNKINYMMDAYVIGALPPYNYLLGGKLLSYLLASQDVREIISKKYSAPRCIKERCIKLKCDKSKCFISEYKRCAGLFTTSLYGRSSQYNRLKFKDRLLYKPIGETKGFGNLHITNETFNAMCDLLHERGIIVSNVFGKGPNWSMRVIKKASELLGINSDTLIKHTFRRDIYYVPFAKNTKEFLSGEHKNLLYYKEDTNVLTDFWKERWYNKRIQNPDIRQAVYDFSPRSFDVKATLSNTWYKPPPVFKVA